MMRINGEKNEIVRDDLERVTKELAEKTKMLKYASISSSSSQPFPDTCITQVPVLRNVTDK